jgi:hypothetical protein
MVSNASYIDALLGPERTRESMFLSRQDIYRLSRLFIPGCFCEFACGGDCLVAALTWECVCCLRIAQWTRASLL